MNNIFTNVAVTDTLAWDSVPSNLRNKAVSVKKMYGAVSKNFMQDSKMHDANFAFLTNALAKLYTKLVEPKYFVTYLEDLKGCIEYGGGFVDYVQSYTVDWAGINNEMRNVVGNGANIIPRVNAGLNARTYNVYTFELAYDLRFIELEKAKQVELQKSIESIYQNIITASWDLFCQKIAYTGGDNNHYGLFNHTDIVPTNVLTASKAGIVDGTVTDTDVIGIINGILTEAYTQSGMNINVLPDTFIVPMWFASALVGRTSPLYTNNLFGYVLEHNFATETSGHTIKINIIPRPGVDSIGTANSGRIVSYKRDKEFVRMDIPYPIKHYITLPNIERMSYTSAFVGQVSEIQFPYTTGTADKASPVQYWDFAA